MSTPPPWKAFSLVSIIGIDLAVCTLIGFWIGNRVDQWLDTGPLWLIVGVFAGLGAGVLSIIPVVKRYLGDLE
ncbi:AtpZ/AtpI family protein [Caldalkalibacillus salinus]|uniref:AtpZ/AtpI family protein n=1 Tax=Caldalkalibacillus salinus TaxID=2803787 RepID=UPI0019222D40|nr:AtpZ/AtpI family protein [Caldalkalibacillus salinus]